jgi:hypothetical protein
MLKLALSNCTQKSLPPVAAITTLVAPDGIVADTAVELAMTAGKTASLGDLSPSGPFSSAPSSKVIVCIVVSPTVN